MNINLKDFERIWREETFLAAAFNEMEDFDSFLDSPSCGIGETSFDEYADEINSYLLPCFSEKEEKWLI